MTLRIKIRPGLRRPGRFLRAAAACLLAAACDGDATGPGGQGGRGLPQRYTVVPVEVPANGGPAGFWPAALGGAGQVLLSSVHERGTFALWSGAGTTLFTPPQPGTATGLNDAGQVVGCTGDQFSDRERRPLLGEAGRLWYLAGAGLERACAHAINGHGVVVGEAGPPGRSRAFVLAGGRVSLIDVPGDTASSAVAVNAAGHVAVNSLRTSRPSSPNMLGVVGQASLWRDGRLVPLGILDWPAAGPGEVADLSRFIHAAADLNDRGEVVGTANGSVCTPDGRSCTGRQRAFLWRAGKMIDLGSGGPDGSSAAVAINRWGHVLVNRYGGRQPGVYLWHEGRRMELNDVVAAAGWRLNSARDLNDAGQVLAILQNPATGAFVTARLDPA